jgi:hypothetical protein
VYTTTCIHPSIKTKKKQEKMMELILEASHINGGFHAIIFKFGLGKTTKFSLGFALGRKS